MHVVSPKTATATSRATHTPSRVDTPPEKARRIQAPTTCELPLSPTKAPGDKDKAAGKHQPPCPKRYLLPNEIRDRRANLHQALRQTHQVLRSALKGLTYGDRQKILEGGNTPALMTAIATESLAAVQTVLDAGAHVNAGPALAKACGLPEPARSDIAILLLDAGAHLGPNTPKAVHHTLWNEILGNDFDRRRALQRNTLKAGLSEQWPRKELRQALLPTPPSLISRLQPNDRAYPAGAVLGVNLRSRDGIDLPIAPDPGICLFSQLDVLLDVALSYRSQHRHAAQKELATQICLDLQALDILQSLFEITHQKPATKRVTALAQLNRQLNNTIQELPVGSELILPLSINALGRNDEAHDMWIRIVQAEAGNYAWYLFNLGPKCYQHPQTTDGKIFPYILQGLGRDDFNEGRVGATLLKRCLEACTHQNTDLNSVLATLYSHFHHAKAALGPCPDASQPMRIASWPRLSPSVPDCQTKSKKQCDAQRYAEHGAQDILRTIRWAQNRRAKQACGLRQEAILRARTKRDTQVVIDAAAFGNIPRARAWLSHRTGDRPSKPFNAEALREALSMRERLKLSHPAQIEAKRLLLEALPDDT